MSYYPGIDDKEAAKKIIQFLTALKAPQQTIDERLAPLDPVQVEQAKQELGLSGNSVAQDA